MNTVQTLVQTVVATAVRSAVIRDSEWPADAVFAVEYQCYNWPTYDQRERVAFFKDVAELREWRKLMKEFARYEDNFFNLCSFYEWDWGPVEKSLDDFDALIAA
jgi:hypothetical protein